MHNLLNFLGNITWCELGKQNIQAKKVYFSTENVNFKEEAMVFGVGDTHKLILFLTTLLFL